MTATVFEPATLSLAQTARADDTDRIRHELWWTVVRALDTSGLPYCILGAPAGLCSATESDIDFVVHPNDYHKVPQLLAAAARRSGAQLVQAIAHESTATYFAIGRQCGCDVAFVNPDCTTDYRRDGRLWLSAEELLRDRFRNSAGFFRPSPEIDFKYYLIKQVLKRTLTHGQWRKLTSLYRTSQYPQVALSLWPAETRAEIERVLGQDRAAMFSNLLPRLSLELKRSPLHENFAERMAASGRELARLTRRALHPTGLFVRITNGVSNQRYRLGLQLSHAVAPAFRRIRVAYSSVNMLLALIASTLVVAPESVVSAPCGGIRLRWHPELRPEENLDTAIATVMSHLSRRTMRRLGLQPAQAYAIERAADARAC